MKPNAIVKTLPFLLPEHPLEAPLQDLLSEALLPGFRQPELVRDLSRFLLKKLDNGELSPAKLRFWQS